MAAIDPDDKTFLVARDDQQTAAIIAHADDLQQLANHAEAVAQLLIEDGVPPHMALSNLTGLVAVQIHHCITADAVQEP